MVQTKKERLKKIVNKEFTAVLKEVAINEAYFNQISHEHAIKTLIKEWQTESGLDPSLQQELTRITQNADPTFKENIQNVGNEVFNALQIEVGGMKTNVQLGELVLQIVSTVVNAMGSAGGRKWAPEEGSAPVDTAGAPMAPVGYAPPIMEKKSLI